MVQKKAKEVTVPYYKRITFIHPFFPNHEPGDAG